MMKKVYITTLHLKHGGCERSISLLANALAKRSYHVTLLCTYNFGKPAYELDPRVEIQYLTDRLPNRDKFHAAIESRRFGSVLKESTSGLLTVIQKRTRLKKAIQEIETGIIIASRDLDAQILSKYAHASPARIKKIAQIHYDPLTDNALIKNLKTKYSNIDHIVTLLPSFVKDLEKEKLPLDIQEKLVSIPNFLSDKYLEDSKKCGSFSQRVNQVIAVGRFEHEKGFDQLLEAWAYISPHYPSWKLCLVGDGSLRRNLETQSKDLGISKSCSFAGLKDEDELSKLYAKSKIFALPSRTEGFGIVLLEAAAHYLPAITFDIPGGPRYLIENGVNGFRAKDIASFAEYLSSMMDNQELMETLGQRNRKKSEEFSEEKIVRKWIKLFQLS